VAVAVAVGYFLGRTRKMRVALTLAAAGATGKLASNPGALLKQGTALLGTSPQLKELADDVRGRLVDTGKAAAVSAVSGQINSLTDRLRERTDALQLPKPPGSAADDERAGAAESYEEDEEFLDDEEPDEELDEASQEEDEEESAAERRRRPAAKRGRSRPSAREDDSAAESDTDADGGSPRRSGASRAATRRSPVRRTRR
jgi:hypothetical protein